MKSNAGSGLCAGLRAALLGTLLTGGTALPASGAVFYTVTESHLLQSFSTDSPSSATSSRAITGFGAGETLEGIDFRPLNGRLMALTLDGSGTGRLYNLSVGTGEATLIAPLSVALDAANFGFDVNPVADRIRITSDQDLNLRVNPDTGEAFVDTALVYAEEDSSSGADPGVTASGYTNSFPGSSETALYGIDTEQGMLVVQNPPNAGILSSVGLLGVAVDQTNGFDIAYDTTNAAYAALSLAGVSQLYSINLATGAATLVGLIGDGTQVIAMSAMPPPPAQVSTLIRSEQSVRVVAQGSGWQELFFNYETGTVSVSPYAGTDGSALYTLPADHWFGIFHYDYQTARYAQGIYERKEAR